MAKSTHSLTETPVNKMLAMMAAPISLGMLSTFLFQVGDTYFVGNFGSAELAALALGSHLPLVPLSTSCIYLSLSAFGSGFA